MILYYTVTCKGPSAEDWPNVWLDKAISINNVDMWSDARSVLKTVMWVDFVQDASGQKTFEAAIQRRGKLEQNERTQQ